MVEKEHIAIFSAYGRANWLALELRSFGYNVTLVDFSEKLGNRSPDVWESPFGIFFSDSITNSQKSWLNEATPIEVKKGFSIILNEGPIELLGALKNHFFEKFKLNKLSTLDKSFKSNWLSFLAHNIASTVYKHNYQGDDEKTQPLPIFEKWNLRLTTRRNYEEQLDALSERGVQVLTQQSLLKMVMDGNTIKSVIVSDKEIKCDRFLFFLSLEEIQFLNKDLVKLFCWAEPLKPQWYWSQFRIIIKPSWVSDAFPKAFSILDPFLPWTHEGFVMVHRGSRTDEFNLWVRLPYNKRFDTEYLKRIGEKIKNAFMSKMPRTEYKELIMPNEYGSSLIATGPATFPVFDKEALQNLKLTEYTNMSFCGPERWDRLDWEAVLNFQRKLFLQIQELNQKKEKTRRRGRDLEIYS